jgi:hypothetical protein
MLAWPRKQIRNRTLALNPAPIVSRVRSNVPNDSTELLHVLRSKYFCWDSGTQRELPIASGLGADQSEKTANENSGMSPGLIQVYSVWPS